MSTKVQVAQVGDEIVISFPYSPSDVERVKALPERRFVKGKGYWTAPANIMTIRCLQEYFRERLVLDNACQALIRDAEGAAAEAGETLAAKIQDQIDVSAVPSSASLVRGKELRKEQLEALALGGRTRRFGYLMDQGTGKTLVYQADAVWAWRRGSIDTALIFTRNNVVDQIATTVLPNHLPLDVPANIGMVRADRNAREQRAWRDFLSIWEDFGGERERHLNFLVANWECLDRLWDWILERVNKRTMVFGDETTQIKAPPKFHKVRGPQNRSAKAITIRQKCAAARIGTGTPIIKRPLDAWSQLYFMDRPILPWGSYTAFKAHFAVTGGFQGRQVLFYKNLEDLSQLISGCTYRCLRRDIPGKIYVDPPPTVDLTKEQRDAYEVMKKEAMVILNDKAQVVKFDDAAAEGVGLDFAELGYTVHAAPIVLTVRMRLRQIVSGYLPIYSSERHPRTGDLIQKVTDYKELVPPAKNPKIQAALEIVEDAGDQKVILWCTFKRELEAMAQVLRDAGVEFVEYHGGTPMGERERAKRRFIEDPACTVFLGNAQAAGTGTDGLQVASIMIFLSNTEHTEVRVQAEDRINRLGQERACTYYDIVARNTVDISTLGIVRGDISLSEQILGDHPEKYL